MLQRIVEKYHNNNVTIELSDFNFAAGDVIAIAADLDAGTLSFAKNGGDWLHLFTSCDFGAEGLFPSITLKDASIEVNFGGQPFKFPDAAYRPAAPDARKFELYRGKPEDVKGAFEDKDYKRLDQERWAASCSTLGLPERNYVNGIVMPAGQYCPRSIHSITRLTQ